MDLPYQPEPLDAMIEEKLFLGNVATAMSASLMEAYGFFCCLLMSVEIALMKFVVTKHMVVGFFFLSVSVSPFVRLAPPNHVFFPFWFSTSSSWS
jgi:hypothetical protein